MSAQPPHKFAASMAGQGDHAMGLAGASDANVPQGTILTRTLYVNITGSLANLSMAGPSTASRSGSSAWAPSWTPRWPPTSCGPP